MAGLIGRQKKGFKVSPVSLRASSGSILSSAAAAAAPGETDERRPRLIRPARLARPAGGAALLSLVFKGHPALHTSEQPKGHRLNLPLVNK